MVLVRCLLDMGLLKLPGSAHITVPAGLSTLPKLQSINTAMVSSTHKHVLSRMTQSKTSLILRHISLYQESFRARLSLLSFGYSCKHLAEMDY